MMISKGLLIAIIAVSVTFGAIASALIVLRASTPECAAFTPGASGNPILHDTKPRRGPSQEF
jgi:uncharacterized membrane protein